MFFMQFAADILSWSSAYFQKKNVCTLTIKELFDFITDVSITKDNIEEYLDKAMSVTSNRMLDDMTEQQKVDEEV